jgi:hypothetical protein
MVNWFRASLILVLLFTISGCGNQPNLETLPKPILYLSQSNGLCGSLRMIDGNRVTWFEQGREASSTGLRKTGTMTPSTYDQLTQLVSSFPEPFSLPAENSCITIKDIIYISNSSNRSTWSICADNQAFEGSLLPAEQILAEIQN